LAVAGGKVYGLDKGIGGSRKKYQHLKGKPTATLQVTTLDGKLVANNVLLRKEPTPAQKKMHTWCCGKPDVWMEGRKNRFSYGWTFTFDRDSIYIRSLESLICAGPPRTKVAARPKATGSGNGNDRPQEASGAQASATTPAPKPGKPSPPQEIVTAYDGVLVKIVAHILKKGDRLAFRRSGMRSRVQVTGVEGRELVLSSSGLIASTEVGELSADDKAALAEASAQAFPSSTAAAVAAFYTSLAGRELAAANWFNKAGAKGDAVRQALAK
jgi:hypothetical protein